jgi:superfamily II DNA/RNA helicase
MIKALSLILQKIDAQNILIFATSKNILKEVHASLESENHKVASVLSNNMSDRVKEADQNQKNIEDFMAGKYRILISTNLLSRGIDMRKVTLVVNLELPRQYSDEK